MRGPLIARRLATSILGVLAVATGLAGRPVVSVLMLALLLAVALVPSVSDDRADALAWLPVGLALAFGVAMGLVTVAGVLGVRLWQDGRGPVTWAAAAAVLALMALVRGGSVRMWSRGSLGAVLVMVPMAAALAWRLGQPIAHWSAPAWEVGDWVNHGEMAVDIRVRGLLDFVAPTPASAPATDIYPRGLHGALAWLSAVGEDTVDPYAVWVQALWSLQAAAAVFAVVAGIGAGALLVRAARAFLPVSRARTAVTVLGLLATAGIFALPGWFDPLVWAGFVTTGAAAVTLFAIALVLVDVEDVSLRLIVVGLLTAVLFWTWPPAAIPALVVLLLLGHRWWRAARPHALVVVGAAAVAVAGSAPLLLVTLTSRGVQQVSAAGAFPSFALPTTLIVVAVAIVAAAVLGRGFGWRVGLPVLAGGLLLAGSGVAVAVSTTAGGLPYYAGKLLWHATVLGTPVLIAAAAWALARGWRALAPLRERAPLLAGALAAVVITVPIAFVAGTAAVAWRQTVPGMAGPLGTEPPRPLDVLDAVPEPAGVAVLPWDLRMGGWDPWRNRTDWQAAQVVRALGAVVPDATTLVAHDVPAACAFLRAHSDAVRVTGSPGGADALVAGGCPAEVVRPARWQVVGSGED